MLETLLLTAKMSDAQSPPPVIAKKTAGTKRAFAAIELFVPPTLHWEFANASGSDAVALRAALITALSNVSPAAEAAARDVGAHKLAATGLRSEACQSYAQAKFDASKKLLSAKDRARVDKLLAENKVLMPMLLDGFFSALDGAFVESASVILSKCAACEHVANCGHYRGQHDALSEAADDKVAIFDMPLNPVFCVPAGSGSVADKKTFKMQCLSLTAALKTASLGINGKMIDFIRDVLDVPLLRVAVNHTEVKIKDVKNVLGVDVVKVHHYRFFTPVRAAPKKPSEFPSRGVDGGTQNSAYAAKLVALIVDFFDGDTRDAYASYIDALGDAECASYGLHEEYTIELDGVTMTLRGADYAFYRQVVDKYNDPAQRDTLTSREKQLAEAYIAGHGPFETRAARRIKKGEDAHDVAAHYKKIKAAQRVAITPRASSMGASSSRARSAHAPENA